MDKVEEQKRYINKVNIINVDNILKYNVQTFGCQQNENDSEKITGMLEQMGYSKAENIKDADIVIFNTCCVRENAEDKLFGNLGELKKQKAQKGTIIAIGGCMMQEEHIVDKIKKSYPYVDIIFGTHTLYRLPENIYKILEKRKRLVDILNIDGEIYEGLPIKRFDKTKASVTITSGCNNFCTYCIVPYVRGRERSRKIEDIVAEVKDLAENGYKEITLLGTNVNSYNGGTQIIDGKKEKIGFATLLRTLNKIDGIERIRFISPHPKDFTDDVIYAIRDCNKVSKIVHLPLQSGSTKILKKMNRGYSKEQFIALANKMKEIIPNVLFSTDIIVGFPEETEEDFQDTLDVVKQLNFEQIYMFIYSRRVGTPADKNPNQVPEDVKHERFNRLKELFESRIEENNLKYVNTVLHVLVEGVSKTNKNLLTARTDSNKVVVFEGDSSNIDKMLDVKIVSQHKWYLKGEII